MNRRALFQSDGLLQSDGLRFAGAWAVLNLLPFLPPLVSPLPLSPYFPLQVEVLVLVTLAVGAEGTRWARAGRVLASAGVFAVLVYQIYDAVVYTAFRRSGLVVEDVQYVVDLGYFALEVATGGNVGMAVLGVAAAAGVGWGVPRLVGVVARTGQAAPARWGLMGAHAVAWTLVVVVAPAQEWGTENLTYQVGNERTRVRTVTAKAVENAEASLRLQTLLDTLGRSPVDSTYFRYDALSLPRRPHVYLYMIESYGEILDRHPDLQAPYRGMMRRVEDTLRAAGWEMATGVSDAPVRGGRSWLAIASVMLGTRVEHQVLYERFRDDPGTQPTLVRFLDRHGYRTVTLQPYTVERPGLPVTNHYGFDAELYRDDLGYTGPDYGWGIVPMPDQYSLGVAHDRFLRAPDAPTFLFFETVFSHALWNYGVPPVVDDWRAFNAVAGTEAEKKEAVAERAVATGLLPDSLTAPSIYDQPTPIRFLRHVGYEVHVAQKHLLEDAPPNSLVLLMGDHPPPLLPTETFGVPVHVLSRDASLLAPFRRHGFTRGLRLPADTSAARRWTHEGLFSLLAHALADSTARPPLRPTGVPRSILVR
jgi:hypothetical protein